MKTVRFALLPFLFMAVLLLATSANAAENTENARVSFGIGSWIPSDSNEWKSGTSYSLSSAVDQGELHLAFGSTEDASPYQMGSFSRVELGFAYRLKPLTKKKGDFDWYAGAGLAYTSTSKIISGYTVRDKGWGPEISVGCYFWKVGVEARRVWAKDTVDIGGTSVGISWIW